MVEKHQGIGTALDGVSETQHAKLRRLVIKGAFATPVIASFAMSALSVEKAAAQTNTTNSKAPSDRRLKTDIVRVGRDPRGFGLYRYRYLWSGQAYVGVMADEVRDVVPEAVEAGADGFLRVDYGRLGLELRPAA